MRRFTRLVRRRLGRFCKCGHPKEEHLKGNFLIRGSSKNNPGTCLHDVEVIGIWVYHSCDCTKFTPKNWPLIHFYKG